MLWASQAPGRVPVLVLKPRVGPPPPPAPRTAHRSPPPNPMALCRNGRPLLQGGQPVSQKISSASLHRDPTSDRPGLDAAVVSKLRSVALSLAWARSLAGRSALWAVVGGCSRGGVAQARPLGPAEPMNAPVSAVPPPRGPLPEREGDQWNGRTEGRSACLREYRPGNSDK